MKDPEILERIRKGDETALQYLYKQHYRMMLRLVLKNSGTEEEAQDVFQDSLILFWQKVHQPDFQLTAKISTFLYSVCYNLWRKELEKKSRLSREEKDEAVIEDWDKQERIQIIHACINKLGATCKKILQYYYFDELSMHDIAQVMGFSNADTAKTKKYKCKKELDELIKKHYKATDFLD
ncbi:RNA polymerase subunit sigma [bacterium 336/3]|nr:RNA polymerase subunit sigma [bacterium 336/3]